MNIWLLSLTTKYVKEWKCTPQFRGISVSNLGSWYKNIIPISDIVIYYILMLCAESAADHFKNGSVIPFSVRSTYLTLISFYTTTTPDEYWNICISVDDDDRNSRIVRRIYYFLPYNIGRVILDIIRIQIQTCYQKCTPNCH